MVPHLPALQKCSIKVRVRQNIRSHSKCLISSKLLEKSAVVMLRTFWAQEQISELAFKRTKWEWEPEFYQGPQVVLKQIKVWKVLRMQIQIQWALKGQGSRTCTSRKFPADARLDGVVHTLSSENLEQWVSALAVLWDHIGGIFDPTSGLLSQNLGWALNISIFKNLPKCDQLHLFSRLLGNLDQNHEANSCFLVHVPSIQLPGCLTYSPLPFHCQVLK